jgi:hypothetical protein
MKEMVYPGENLYFGNRQDAKARHRKVSLPTMPEMEATRYMGLFQFNCRENLHKR